MAGKLYTVGVGPGDPELVTIKAARLIAGAQVIAYFAKRGSYGHARQIAAPYIVAGTEELRLDYPYTTDMECTDPRYAREMAEFYASAATAIAAHLAEGRDVVLLCEGDPFFYGSSMHLFDRLGHTFKTEVVPGVTGMSGCWTSAATPMLRGDEVLAVLPGTLPETELVQRLADCDAAVIMKVGRNLQKIRTALASADKLDRAIYIERGTMRGERILPMSGLAEMQAPYFSLILVPGVQGTR
jgi:precorrin-2/cobalt-factor-2 C20-methyltransferase